MDPQKTPKREGGSESGLRDTSVEHLPPVPQSPRTNTEILSELKPPELGIDVVTYDSRIDSLPVEQQSLVRSALGTKYYSEFRDSLQSLVRLGGIHSAHALAILISEAATDDGLLSELSMGGRNVTVYSLAKAMLKVAGASRLSDYQSVHPSTQLTKAEKKEVWDFLKSLARGDHGDVEVATGVRGLLLERIGEVPGVGRALNLLLSVAGAIDGTPSGGPPRLLFVLYDLPWAFRSRLPFASVESRKDNLAELLYRDS